MPTTLHPLIFPNWQTIEPTAPAAVETTIVYCFLGLARSHTAKYAMKPEIPNTPKYNLGFS